MLTPFRVILGASWEPALSQGFKLTHSWPAFDGTQRALLLAANLLLDIVDHISVDFTQTKSARQGQRALGDGTDKCTIGQFQQHFLVVSLFIIQQKREWRKREQQKWVRWLVWLVIASHGQLTECYRNIERKCEMAVVSVVQWNGKAVSGQ